MVLLAAAALAYATLPGFGRTVNQRADAASTEARRLVNPGYVEVPPASTRASSEIADHPAQSAADLVSNDYWAADRARDQQPTLTFTFRGRTELDYLVVTSGAAIDYARLARPRNVQITYSDGSRTDLTLKDDRQPASYAIHASGVTSATLRIVSVYPGSDSTAVAIAEVEFFRLR